MYSCADAERAIALNSSISILFMFLVFRFSRRFAPQNDSEKSSFLRMTVYTLLLRMTVTKFALQNDSLHFVPQNDSLHFALQNDGLCFTFQNDGLCFAFRHCRLDRQSPDSALLRSPIRSGMTLQGFVEVTPHCHCKASKKVHSHCHCKAS